MGQCWSSCKGTAGELVVVSHNLMRYLFDRLKTNVWFCFCASCVRPCCKGFVIVLLCVFGWPFMCWFCFQRIIKFFRNRLRKKESSRDDEALEENTLLSSHHHRYGRDIQHLTVNEMSHSSRSGKRKYEETCDETTGNVRKRKSHSDEEAGDGNSKHQAEFKNYLFFMNKLRSEPDGDFIDEIHKSWYGDYSLLERHHGYIQWLFPLPECGVNWHAAVLQQKEIELLISNDVARERLLKSYEMMLDFYGIELVSMETGEVRRAENWLTRFENLNRNGHNNLRITRILHSISLLGFNHLQYPLVAFLLKEILVERTLPRCQHSCFNFWMQTLSAEQYESICQYAKNLEKETGVLEKDHEVTQTQTRVRRLIRSLSPNTTAESNGALIKSSEVASTEAEASSRNTTLKCDVESTFGDNSESTDTESIAGNNNADVVSENVSSTPKTANAVTANDNLSARNGQASDGTVTESTLDDSRIAANNGGETPPAVNTQVTVSTNHGSNTENGGAESTVSGSKQTQNAANKKDASESTRTDDTLSNNSHAAVAVCIESAEQSPSKFHEGLTDTSALVTDDGCKKYDEQTSRDFTDEQSLIREITSLALHDYTAADSTTKADEETSSDLSDCQATTEGKSDHKRDGPSENNQPSSDKIHNHQADSWLTADSCAYKVDIMELNDSQLDTQKEVGDETEKYADKNLGAAVQLLATDHKPNTDKQAEEKTASTQLSSDDFQQEDLEQVDVATPTDEKPDVDSDSDRQNNEPSGDNVPHQTVGQRLVDEASDQQLTASVQ